MPKYRKRPIVIEAAQIPATANAGRWAVFYDFLERPDTTVDIRPTSDGGYDVTTLEGVMHANPDDWLILGIRGEIYPCKPDIFEATHETVDAPYSVICDTITITAGPIDGLVP